METKLEALRGLLDAKLRFHNGQWAPLIRELLNELTLSKIAMDLDEKNGVEITREHPAVVDWLVTYELLTLVGEEFCNV